MGSDIVRCNEEERSCPHTSGGLTGARDVLESGACSSPVHTVEVMRTVNREDRQTRYGRILQHTSSLLDQLRGAMTEDGLSAPTRLIDDALAHVRRAQQALADLNSHERGPRR
jgi:hypothetical protein